MSPYRFAAAGVLFGLCCATSLAAGANHPCARGTSEFCLATPVPVPVVRAGHGGGWSHWASGARMRWGGAPAMIGHVVDGAEFTAASVYLVRIPLDAAASGTRSHPPGIGSSWQALDPASAAIHGSYALSESFSLDLTAGRGRIGLRGIAPGAAYGTSPAFGFPAGAAFDRTAWSVALNATRQFGALGIGGRIGYVDVRDQPELAADAGGLAPRLSVERASSVRKSFLGIDASYELTRNWQFHGGAIYRRDEGRSGAPFTSGFGPLATGDEKEWGVGVRYYGWRNFKLNVEYLRSSGRDQLGNESLLFMGRFDF